MDYRLQFLEFLSPLHKHGLSYTISGISYTSQKTWTIICNLSNFFTFFKNMVYHKKFMEFRYLFQKRDYHMQILEFLSLFQKPGQSYAIYEISFSSSKTWSIKCNLSKLFPFSKNVDYRMQFLEFLSLLQKHGLSYAIFEISFSSRKTWSILCNFRKFVIFS